MKIGIILEAKEYEKAWNAFHFAITVKKQGHEVKLFLMGEAAARLNISLKDHSSTLNDRPEL